MAVAVFGATNALANHDANSLHACASNANGSLRLVTSASDCRSNETAVEWNKQGLTGPQGPQGPAGVPDMSSVVALSNRVDALEASLRAISGQITLSWTTLQNSGGHRSGEIWIEASALQPGSALTLEVWSSSVPIEMPVSAAGTYSGLPGPVSFACDLPGHTFRVVGTGRFGTVVTSNTLGNCS